MALRRGFEERIASLRKLIYGTKLPERKKALTKTLIKTGGLRSGTATPQFEGLETGAMSEILGERGRLGEIQTGLEAQESAAEKTRGFQSVEAAKQRDFTKSERIKRQEFVEKLESLRTKQAKKLQRKQLLTSLLDKGASMLTGGLAGLAMPKLMGEKPFLKGALIGSGGVASRYTGQFDMDSLKKLLDEYRR